MKFNEKIKKLRLNLGETQQDMADLLNITRQNYGRYELGQRKPTFDMIIKLADFFGVTIDYLLRPDLNKKDDINYIDHTGINVEILNKDIYLSVPKSWIKDDITNYFLFIISDDSMIDSHILDKSLLLFKRQSDLENDQIGAFSLNSKEYIRIYKKLNSGTILLQSANSNYDDIEVTENDDFKIIGVLKKIIISY